MCLTPGVRSLQAAHAILQQQETGKPVYKVKSVSLVTLCRTYDAPINPQKEHIKKVTVCRAVDRGAGRGGGDEGRLECGVGLSVALLVFEDVPVRWIPVRRI